MRVYVCKYIHIHTYRNEITGKYIKQQNETEATAVRNDPGPKDPWQNKQFPKTRGKNTETFAQSDGGSC